MTDGERVRDKMVSMNELFDKVPRGQDNNNDTHRQLVRSTLETSDCERRPRGDQRRYERVTLETSDCERRLKRTRNGRLQTDTI